MIRKLRINFILVAMSSTFIVLALIMILLNFMNYQRIIERADTMIDILQQNEGHIPEPQKENAPPKADAPPKENGSEEKEPPKEKKKEKKAFPLSPEAPYETRYFAIELNKDGKIIQLDLNNIASVTEEDAKMMADEVLEKKLDEGMCNRFRYRIERKENKNQIVFLNIQKDLSTFRVFLFTSILTSVLGFVTVFVLVYIFSRYVFKPVETGYEKQKQFITDASHEIKTPLTIIDANMEVLEMEHGNNQWIESTRNQVKRLTSMTHQLICLSRLDENRYMDDKKVFSLTDAVSETADAFESIALTAGKSMETQLEEQADVYGNENYIRQLIGILLDNAIKYSPTDTVIEIRLKRKYKKLLLEIENVTDGMEKGRQDVLFERFYRRDSSRCSETGGAGIGLSVARAIVDAHKGKITANSPDGVKLIISVIL